MKATGIVRRIDDLGRVVIPKEIRRTLRIREEIRSKFIPQRTARLFLKIFACRRACGVCVTIRRCACQNQLNADNHNRPDHVIAAAGVSKREFLERRVTTVLEGYMENRKTYSATQQTLGDIQPIEGIEHYASVIYPIIAAGDVSCGSYAHRRTDQNPDKCRN